jgi:hypothetical protein
MDTEMEYMPMNIKQEVEPAPATTSESVNKSTSSSSHSSQAAPDSVENKVSKHTAHGKQEIIKTPNVASHFRRLLSCSPPCTVYVDNNLMNFNKYFPIHEKEQASAALICCHIHHKALRSLSLPTSPF